MTMKCIIKLIGSEAEGVSKRSGNQWKARTILLEWTDEDGLHRVWATMFNDVMDHFNHENLSVGNECIVSLLFSGHSFRTGYSTTEVKVLNIQSTLSTL